jgi:hypothetical protein
MTNNPNGRGGWQKGQSGNPSGLPGRPLGSRHKLSEAFIRDVASEWERSGKIVLQRMVKDNPVQFAQLAAGLLPKESAIDVKIAVERKFEEMSHRELIALRSAYDAAIAAEPLQIEDNSADD